ncbi:Acetophenone carboxylase gamma subunit [archaeon HR06]|nr:Acetophenone carboxylase gamma subunit [archaeon HR06]
MGDLRVGIDVGGTYTDLLAIKDGDFINIKVSTTERPEEGILEALKLLLKENNRINTIIHSTTLATNLLLGQKGLDIPKVALVTTKGFKDVLEIGRQKRAEIYNLFFERPKPLIKREYRFEVPERINYKGEVVEPLNLKYCKNLAKKIKKLKFEAVAICLINSYKNPEHEFKLKDIIIKENKDLIVCTSYETIPEYREYERMSTTVVNTILFPSIKKYLKNLEDKIRELGIKVSLKIMQSNGGIVASERVLPFTIIESGPAAGVIASSYLCKILGIDKAISFDMGGTTAKAGVIVNYNPEFTNEYEVGGKVHLGRVVKGSGYPIRFPFIDLAECSAGGGTIAWIDAANTLRVGPISAGANPGPACYDKGGKEATVTDANLILGRLPNILAGNLRLNYDLAFKAIKNLSEILNLDPIDVASGIIKIVNSNMSKILRIVTFERGYDPRDFTLISFGGAGPMHSCPLAEELKIKRILIPPNPGLFSSYGLLVSDYTHNFVKSIVKKVKEVDEKEIEREFKEMIKMGEEVLNEEGVKERDFYSFLDMRYVGQAYELQIPFKGSLEDAEKNFHLKHEILYGYSSKEEEVEIVNLKLKFIGYTEKPKLKEIEESKYKDGREGLIGKRRVFFEEFQDTPIYLRERLKAKDEILGPAIIEQYDSTIVIYPNWSAKVDNFGNILLERW